MRLPSALITLFAAVNVWAEPPAPGPASPKAKMAFPGMDPNSSKQPTYIKSDTLTLKSAERYFVYNGNVEVKQDDMTLTGNILEGRYDEKNQIKDLTARENILIVKGEKIRATGERAVYDKATETEVLTENPELQQEGSVLTADRIKLFLNENRSVAEGQVRVKLIKGAGTDASALDITSSKKK